MSIPEDPGFRNIPKPINPKAEEIKNAPLPPPLTHDAPENRSPDRPKKKTPEETAKKTDDKAQDQLKKPPKKVKKEKASRKRKVRQQSNQGPEGKTPRPSSKNRNASKEKRKPKIESTYRLIGSTAPKKPDFNPPREGISLVVSISELDSKTQALSKQLNQPNRPDPNQAQKLKQEAHSLLKEVTKLDQEVSIFEDNKEAKPLTNDLEKIRTQLKEASSQAQTIIALAEATTDQSNLDAPQPLVGSEHSLTTEQPNTGKHEPSSSKQSTYSSPEGLAKQHTNKPATLRFTKYSREFANSALDDSYGILTSYEEVIDKLEEAKKFVDLGKERALQFVDLPNSPELKKELKALQKLEQKLNARIGQITTSKQDGEFDWKAEQLDRKIYSIYMAIQGCENQEQLQIYIKGIHEISERLDNLKKVVQTHTHASKHTKQLALMDQSIKVLESEVIKRGTRLHKRARRKEQTAAQQTGPSASVTRPFRRPRPQKPSGTASEFTELLRRVEGGTATDKDIKEITKKFAGLISTDEIDRVNNGQTQVKRGIAPDISFNREQLALMKLVLSCSTNAKLMDAVHPDLKKNTLDIQSKFNLIKLAVDSQTAEAKLGSSEFTAARTSPRFYSNQRLIQLRKGDKRKLEVLTRTVENLSVLLAEDKKRSLLEGYTAATDAIESDIRSLESENSQDNSRLEQFEKRITLLEKGTSRTKSQRLKEKKQLEKEISRFTPTPPSERLEKSLANFNQRLQSLENLIQVQKLIYKSGTPSLFGIMEAHLPTDLHTANDKCDNLKKSKQYLRLGKIYEEARPNSLEWAEPEFIKMMNIFDKIPETYTSIERSLDEVITTEKSMQVQLGGFILTLEDPDFSKIFRRQEEELKEVVNELKAFQKASGKLAQALSKSKDPAFNIDTFTQGLESCWEEYRTAAEPIITHYQRYQDDPKSNIFVRRSDQIATYMNQHQDHQSLLKMTSDFNPFILPFQRVTRIPMALNPVPNLLRTINLGQQADRLLKVTASLERDTQRLNKTI